MHLPIKTLSIVFIFLIQCHLDLRANAKVDSLLNLAETTKSDSLKAWALNAAAYQFLFSDAEKATQLIQQAEAIGKIQGNEYVYGQILNTKGNLFAITGQLDSAEYWFNKALDLTTEFNFSKILSMTHNNLGLMYWRSGRFEEAQSQFFKALKLLESSENPGKETMAKYLNNIGLIYQELNQLDEAIKYHNQALELRKELGNLHEQCISEANLGVCYVNKQDFEQADYYYRSAIDHAKQSENTMMYYALHDNLGMLRIQQNRLNEAVGALLTSYNKPSSLPVNPKSDLSILSNLCKAYLLLNQLDNAGKYGQLGAKLLEQYPELRPFSQALSLALAEYYFRSNQLVEARAWSLKYKEVTESNFSESNAQALAQQKTQFETEKKEQTILLQEAEIEEQKAINQRNILLLSLLGLSAIAIVLIAWVIIKNKNKRLLIAEQQKELISRQRQLQINLATQELERKRFAKDLHDSFGQLITGIQISIKRIKETDKLGDRAEEYLNADTLIKQMHEEIRRTAFNLMPATLEQSGLPAALTELGQRLSQQHKITVIASHFDFPERIEEFSEIHLFRITQEWINNVLKYANPQKIEIQLISHEDNATLMIEDDGAGFDTKSLQSASGHGWKNIQSRIHMLSGSLHIDSQPGKIGTTLIIDFPLKANKDNASSDFSKILTA